MTVITLGILLTVLLVAWLTTAATAVRSASRLLLRRWVERQLAGAANEEASVARPQRLVTAASIGIAATLWMGGMALGASSEVAGGRLALVTLMVAALTLAFGQLLPRAIARRWGPELMPAVVPPLGVAEVLFRPLDAAGRALARGVGVEERPSSDDALEEVEDLLREGQLEGIGGDEEIEIITGVVQFGQTVVRDVMTPRTDVFAVDIDTTPRELARLVAESGYSRVPVYRDSLDDVVGFVHAYDLLKAPPGQAPRLRNVSLAPEFKRCGELLFEMLRRQRHLAVVMDEFGGTAGIVTLEDLLEELVGDIRDEHDEPAPEETTPGQSAVLVDASLEVGEICRMLGLGRPDEEIAERPVAGLLPWALDRIPIPGEQFRLGDLELTVVAAEPSHVVQVLARRADAPGPIELIPPG